MKTITTVTIIYVAFILLIGLVVGFRMINGEACNKTCSSHNEMYIDLIGTERATACQCRGSDGLVRVRYKGEIND